MAGYQEIAASKRANREKAVESAAHAYVAETHSKFLNASGMSSLQGIHVCWRAGLDELLLCLSI